MSNRDIHYRYGISYLVVIIVALTAFGLFDVPNLVDKISFALTIASLVLAVVAIIYTFLAANKQDAQLTALVETHHSISSAAQEIQRAAGSLLGHVSAIPSRLELITSKIDSLSQPEAAKLLPAPADPDDVVRFSDRQFKRFISEIPFGAMSVLYAFHVACQHGKVLTEPSVASWSPVSWDFAVGVLCSTEGTGLIQFKYHKGEIVPVSCSETLQRNIKNYLIEVSEIVSAEQGEALKERMAMVEREFA